MTGQGQATASSGGALDDEAHAGLVRSIVGWLRQVPGVRTFCEVPYNYYGERGVIDIVALAPDSSFASPWRGVACEVKPVLRDLGATMRQVRKAESYFQLPPVLPIRGQPLLRFPLILAANETNFLAAVHFAQVLDGIEVHFFSPEDAFTNPFESAWRARKESGGIPVAARHGHRPVSGAPPNAAPVIPACLPQPFSRRVLGFVPPRL